MVFETTRGLFIVVTAIVHSLMETPPILILLGDELVQTRHVVVLHQGSCWILPEGVSLASDHRAMGLVLEILHTRPPVNE